MTGELIQPSSPQAPDPRDFSTLIEWLRAALTARGESPIRVALDAGLSKNALHEWLAHPDRKPTITTVDRLAAYFDVDQVELRAMRALMPKNPNRVAAGRGSGRPDGRGLSARALASLRSAAALTRPRSLGGGLLAHRSGQDVSEEGRGAGY